MSSCPTLWFLFQIKEAVAEAEASLPDIVAVLPAGRGSQETQPALQAFINTVLVGVSWEAKQTQPQQQQIGGCPALIEMVEARLNISPTPHSDADRWGVTQDR